MAQPPPILTRLFATTALLAWGLAPGGEGPSARVRAALKDDRLSRADEERRERGYYEPLLDAGRRLDAPESTRTRARPAGAAFDAGPLAMVVGDVREYILKPGLKAEPWGVAWSTNALGMRDRAHTILKPPGTFRIALVGDSIGAGWGVEDGGGFEPALERALDGRSRAAGGPAVEVLNFCVPGHAPGQRWEDFGGVGWRTGPDLVLYEATLADVGWDERRLRSLLARGIGWNCRPYGATLARAGATPGRDAEAYRRILRPARWAILAGVYRVIADDCRARGVPSVWVLVPRVGRPGEAAERGRLMELARRSGFSMVVDLSDAFDGVDPATLAIAPTDYHPNAEGHARLAKRLESALARWIGDTAGHRTGSSASSETRSRPSAPRPALAGRASR